MTRPMNQISEKYHQMQGRAKETAENVAHVTDSFVHDNPWWTLGMVAVTALVIGVLLGQSRD